MDVRAQESVFRLSLVFKKPRTVLFCPNFVTLRAIRDCAYSTASRTPLVDDQLLRSLLNFHSIFGFLHFLGTVPSYSSSLGKGSRAP